MRLYYYPLINFGDASLNTWLWPQLLPGMFSPEATTLFVGIGSLLNEYLPHEPLKVIFGAGAGYGKVRPKPDARWVVYFVRGPATARILGLEPEMAISDGAMLVGALVPPDLPKTNPVAFMPHWRSDYHGDWQRVCQIAGIHYIDPTAGAASVLDGIQRSRLLLTDALHGAVVADALRVPWVPIRIYPQLLAFKWQDWCASIGLPYEPVRQLALYQETSVSNKLHSLLSLRLPPRLVTLVTRAGRAVAHRLYPSLSQLSAASLRRLAQTGRPWLSTDHVLDTIRNRLQEKLESLKRDYAQGRLA